MRYVSIDIETTGLDPDKCQIIELAAVIDDLVTPFEELPKFRYLVKEPTYRGEPYAFSMHAALFREIATRLEPSFDPYRSYGVNEDIMESEARLTGCLRRWLEENDITPSLFLAAGKNFAGFDARFMRRLPRADLFTWEHRVLDPGPLYMLPTDTIVPSTNTCIERAEMQGMEAHNIPGDPHTALYDALMVCALIRNHFNDAA
jgi:DNA polymerase III epsilon subunit-like protein